jgi:hypothetical protein
VAAPLPDQLLADGVPHLLTVDENAVHVQHDRLDRPPVRPSTLGHLVVL